MAQEKVTSERVKLLISLHILQLCFAGFHIVSRVALKQLLAKLCILFTEILLHCYCWDPLHASWKSESCERKTTSHILFFDQFFFLALVGITANQGFYILGLYYASPTFAYAMQNSVPAITFVMATALRIEQVHISRIDGMAKLLGTLASVGESAELDMGMYIPSWSLLILDWLDGPSAFVERDPKHWQIKSGEEISTVLYAVNLHT
ncbi:hypothetical protein BUALT_Bualt07G0116300 [Buddleja alternifolia]|uniref:WAT1-related protein n=1 Tax=Buddleja alternifolia TaxID=168488 RepID=A0AAV6XEG0_9LAMI|nr:hypothetical protein BUALT_Bualt07G0116300 [Buddleja alternifolia]